MNKQVLWASIALFSLAIATPALADNLNPQPEPPGKNKLHKSWTHTNMIGSATGGAGSGKALVVRKAGGTQMNATTSAAATHGFNPQPDPPGNSQTQTQQ